MTDINEYRLTMAKECGAYAVINAKEKVPEKVRELNNGRGADLVIICTGAYPAFIQGLESVDRGGVVLCFATTDPGVNIPLPINAFWRNGITVLPSYANSGYDAKVAISLLEHKIVDVTRIITHRFGLADTGKGFSLMAAAKDSMKIIINPQE
jgi:L-iditol 2-dehydrogenase